MQYRVAVLASMVAVASGGAVARADMTIYLERHGATVTAGRDDAARGTSSLVWSRGLRGVRVPAFNGGERTWAQVVQCVRDGFAPFAVEIVDQRPADGDYVMIVVGGRPGMLGYGDGVSGVAPWDGNVIPRAIGFVFSDHLEDRAQSVCNGVMHEAGHTMGLDHSYYCPDVMSYLYGCGEKSFTHVDVACGEYEERTCAQGGSAQNSYELLADNVGLRSGGTESEDDDSPQPDSFEQEPDEEQPEDQLEIWAPADGTVTSGNSYVAVAVRADADSVVELGWATSQRTYSFRCDEMPANVAAACYQEGDITVFALMVGVGQRAFAVRVTDGDGNQRVSAIRKVTFR